MFEFCFYTNQCCILQTLSPYLDYFTRPMSPWRSADDAHQLFTWLQHGLLRHLLTVKMKQNGVGLGRPPCPNPLLTPLSFHLQPYSSPRFLPERKSAMVAGTPRCDAALGPNVFHTFSVPVALLSRFFNYFFLFSELLVVVLGPVSVEELISVEDTSSARFARCRRKINIPLCSWV